MAAAIQIGVGAFEFGRVGGSDFWAINIVLV